MGGTRVSGKIGEAVWHGLSEQTIQQQIRLACSRGPVRLHRNNTGVLRDRNGRPVQFGLAKGSADLIGWTTRTITPEMVGQRIAVFTSIEVKTATGRLRPEQRQWMEAVQAAGGIAGVARSVEDAIRLTTAACDGTMASAHKPDSCGLDSPLWTREQPA